MRQTILLLSCFCLSLPTTCFAQKKVRPEKTNPNWIWLNKDNGHAEPTAVFRKEFDGGGVSAARLYATCDNEMKIFIDGKLVLESKTWELSLIHI